MTEGSSGAGERLAGALLVAAAAIIWSTLGLVAKNLYAQGVSFEALVAFRATGAFLVVFGFMLFTGRVASLRVGGGDLASLVPLGAISIGAFYLLYSYTIRESPVGTAAILLYSSPAFVVVLARVFLKEALSASRLVALLLTASGIAFVVGVNDLATLDVRPFVVLTGLGSGLAYGLFSVIGKPLTGRLPRAVIICYILGVGAVILIAVALPTLDTLAGLPAGSYALLAASAIAQTALAYALYTAGLKRLEAGQAAITATIEPVAAVLIGTAFLNEELTALKVVGAVLVVCGAVLAQLRRRKPRKARPSPA